MTLERMIYVWADKKTGEVECVWTADFDDGPPPGKVHTATLNPAAWIACIANCSSAELEQEIRDLRGARRDTDTA